MDSIDRDILIELRKDAKITQRELGTRVGLSPNAAAGRVAKLTQQGVITGFHAHLDQTKLGRPIEATIDIWLDERTHSEEFMQFAAEDDRVVELLDLTGPVDFRMRVWVDSAAGLATLLEDLRVRANVRQSDSRLIMRRHATPWSN